MKEEVLALLKERGLETTEEAAKELVELSREVFKLIVKLTPNKIDDVLWASVDDMYTKTLLGLAENINKADNE